MSDKYIKVNPYPTGINTVNTRLGDPASARVLHSEPPNPKFCISPWTDSSGNPSNLNNTSNISQMPHQLDEMCLNHKR